MNSSRAYGGWLVAALLGGLLACSRSDLRGDERTACVPGIQVACACAQGAGVQRCSPSGDRFESCQCGDSPAQGGSGNTPGGPGSGARNTGGSGSTDCGEELRSCQGVCVDLATSREHCGACAHACEGDELCTDGVCAASCPPKETRCGADCANLDTSAEHCGACRASCATDEICEAGDCDCLPGFVRCAGACVDLSSSDDHCGACSTPCPGASACALGSCGQESADWPTLGFDMHRGGVNPSERGVPPLSASWSKSVATSALNPVVVERGRVIVSGNPRFEDDGPIYALRVLDGEQLWVHDFGEVSSLGHASIVDGRVYVAHGKGGSSPPERAGLHCLDAASGRRIWQTIVGAQWEHYWAPAVSDDLVYVNGGAYGGLYGFSRTTGTEVFFAELEQYDEWSPTLSDAGVLTMVAGNLRIHRPDTGGVLETIKMVWDWRGWSMDTLVAERNGIAYAIAPPTLYAYELEGKFLQWQSAADFSSYPAVSTTHVYALNGGGLTALALSTGDELWSFEGDGMLSYPPVVAAGHVYVASADHVYALDADTGSSVWQADEGGWLSLAAGRLFVARADGVLSVFTLSEPL